MMSFSKRNIEVKLSKTSISLKRNELLIFLLFTFYFFSNISCNNTSAHPPRIIDRAFYFWKSSWQPGSYEKQKLDSLKVNDIYLKYFDVAWDAGSHQPMPVAMIRFKEKPAYNITPVVFITNECLQQTDTLQIKDLADKILSAIVTINTTNAIDSIKEIQIDCDWSATTREKYFALLREIREKLYRISNKEQGILKKEEFKVQLSCTIRLYQIKYRDKAGIPPVNKGLLMCYNMGNLKNISSANSIIEKKEFDKYITGLSSYPLPLDIALPIFDWKVWFRNGQYHGITEAFPDSLLLSPVFIKKENRYYVTCDTLLQGYDFKKGDLLRYEESRLRDIIDIADDVSLHLKNTRCKVALYHLDAVLLNKYSTHELESIYNSLR
ncbi:MAG: hypothetical protein ABJA78_07510 [Ferruginibacter sp.]